LLTFSLLWKTAQDLPSCRLFPISNMPCFTTPKQLYNTCQSRYRMGTSKRGTLSSCLRKIISRLNHFNLTFTAWWLAPIVLNIWRYRRLPDVCYLVVDLPCQSGTFTHRNYRPCSAAHPMIFRSIIKYCVPRTFQNFFQNFFYRREKIDSENIGATRGKR
jgi:hypothetical protein